jgi:hypothetical protein
MAIYMQSSGHYVNISAFPGGGGKKERKKRIRKDSISAFHLYIYMHAYSTLLSICYTWDLGTTLHLTT